MVIAHSSLSTKAYLDTRFLLIDTYIYFYRGFSDLFLFMVGGLLLLPQTERRRSTFAVL